MPPTVTRNPFVGPRPILNGEEIFGRDTEIRRLTHLLLAERIVLLHSPSGAGKSSLIQAGFLSSFSRETEDDFYIFPTIRLSVTAGLEETGSALFSKAVVRSFEQAENNGQGSDDFESLAEYLLSRGKQKANGRCICLVFDQFEECVTFPAGHETAKRAFFADLGNTLADQNVWALFAVREDFLAPIVDLGRVLPTRLKQTFRLDFLSKETAGDVIQKTANLGNYKFSPEALKRLVDDLAIVNVQEADGKFQTVAGEFVEPLHLQVACQYIIQALPEGTMKIESHHLERTKNGGPRPETNVDEALAAYYRNELSQIAGGDKQKEKDLRFWIEEKLIDVNGVRIPVRQGVRTTEGLENEAIEKLSNAYLARKERRLNATWYELAHDRLVQPILIDNREWFDRNLGPIGKGCRLWLKNKRDPFYLLKGRELKEALLQYGSKARTLSADENDFIRESRNVRRTAALRFWGPLVGASFLILLSLWTTWYFYRTKSDLEYYKLFTVLRPLYTAWTPGSADRNVLFASHLAKKLGDRKASIDPVLFGDIVTILDRALDRRQRLLETHWNYRSPASKNVGNPIPVLAVSYSPDGQTLVAGDENARMRILRRNVLSDPIPVAGGKIRSVTYSPDGKLVAIGTENGFVSIYAPGDSSQSGAPVQLGFPGSNNRAPEVWSCSWNGQGDLAAGCQDGKIYIWPDLLHASQLAGAQPLVVLNNIGNKPIHVVAWQDSGAVLAAGDAAGHLCLWNSAQISSAPGITNSGPISISAGTEAIWSLAWSKDGRLASGSWDHSISIWKIDSLAQALVALPLNRKVQAHDAWVRDVAWINNDQAIVSIGDDGMVKFWKAPDLTTDVPSEQVPTSNLWKLSYNPATKLIATANDDGAIRIYQRDPPARHRVYGNGVSTIVRLAFSGSEVLSFDQDGRVYRFDPASEKEEKTQIASRFQSDIKAVEFHPQIKSFVIGYGRPSVGGQLAVWDSHQNSTPTFCPIGEAIRAVSCHPTKLMVAFVTHRGTLGLRTVPELQQVSTQPDLRIVSDRGTANAPGTSERSNSENSSAQNRRTGDVGRLIWSNSGDMLFLPLNRLNGDPNKSQILRFKFDGQSLTELDPFTLSVADPIFSVQLHPTDPLLAIGTTGGALVLASLVSSQTQSFVAHDRTIESLAWTPDGHRLFSAGADGSIKVWDYDAKGKHKLTLVITLRHDVGGVYAAAVSPDGRLYSAGDSPRVFSWPEARYSTEAILDRAKKMINRNMFGPEWALYIESNNDQQGRYEKTFEDLPDLSQSKSD
jgi:WD40 repeat protein